jgi:tetratricopeptide (TPR) repeat protein
MMADYIRQRIEENTIGSLREAVRLSPNDAVAWARLGRSVLRPTALDPRQQITEAEAYSQRAIQLAPENLEGLWTRVEVLDRNGRLPEAMESLRRAVAQQPVDPAFWLSCGTLLEKTNQLVEATAAYSRAIELAKARTSTVLKIRTKALLSRGKLFQRLGREAEARDDLDKAQAIQRGFSE